MNFNEYTEAVDAGIDFQYAMADFADYMGMTDGQLDEALYPEDYVSAADYLAPSDTEREELDTMLDIEALD